VNNFTLIQVNPVESEDALSLIKALDQELLQMYPDESVHILDLSKTNGNNTIFMVGYLDNNPVACGAITTLEPQMGEIKRMFVKPEARGLGLSKQIISRLEQEALEMGFDTIRLEAGAEQTAALELYRKCGYYDIPKFGEYIDDPHSMCMEKRLV
jgi:putative acetyltransferase